MFTGIVEQIGSVLDVAEQAEGRRLVLSGQGLVDVPVGASIAVNGVCLTAVKVEDERVTVEVIPETLNRTNLGEVGTGGRVNLERPMRADGRFDGHIVQGHVDGVGRIRRFGREDHEALLHVECDAELAQQLVDKGSVTIDGVSLTVVRVVEDGFHVALIPHTLDITTLSNLSVGDAVNLEVDVFGKYVKQYLDRVLPDLVANAQGARRDESK